MNIVTVTEEKRMTVTQRKEAMPYSLMADGSIIATVSNEEKEEPEKVEERGEYEPYDGKVKCPNCKFVIQLPKKNAGLPFFSIHHP